VDLLNYLKDELISFTVYRATITIDGDGVQSETFNQVTSGSGDLQSISINSRRNEAGLNIIGSHVLYLKNVDIKVNDEIHIDGDIYKVVDVQDLKDFLEVHVEIRD